MKFEEQFPSISDFDIWIPNGVSDAVVDLETVEAKCLDKQRVIEAFNSVFNVAVYENADAKLLQQFSAAIYRELGLED